jgi:hypothetical protein
MTGREETDHHSDEVGSGVARHGLNAPGEGLAGIERVREQARARVAAEQALVAAGFAVGMESLQRTARERIEAERTAVMVTADSLGREWLGLEGIRAGLLMMANAIRSIDVNLDGVVAGARLLLGWLTPANIRNLDVADWERLVEISAEQRVGLLWSPGEAVLVALLGAENEVARERVINERAAEIVADCAVSLDTVTDEPVGELAGFGLAAVRAFEAGHVEAAQALATNVLDTGIRLNGGEPSMVQRVVRAWLPLSEEETVTLREFRSRLAAAAIPAAYLGYKPGSGDPRFSRNGTAHVVNGALYTPGNAARAISLASTWLRLVQETSWQGISWHGEPLVPQVGE